VNLAWHELLAFLGLCLILAATPGANLAVVLRCASLGGQRAAVGASVGLTLGKIFWAIASLVGLAALLAASATAYQALRLAGAVYLVWLGVQALLSARRRSSEAAQDGTAEPREILSFRGGLRRGLIGDLLNPKVGLFYTTVFPQFIGPGDAVAPMAAVLVAGHALVLLTWYPGVTYLVSRAGRVLKRPHLAKLLDRVMGTILIAMGVRLAAASR
jgi:threonine/homoserine/homoserine lactone efflux protein